MLLCRYPLELSEACICQICQIVCGSRLYGLKMKKSHAFSPCSTQAVHNGTYGMRRALGLLHHFSNPRTCASKNPANRADSHNDLSFRQTIQVIQSSNYKLAISVQNSFSLAHLGTSWYILVHPDSKTPLAIHADVHQICLPP